MKLKYILTSLIAALFVFSACNKETTEHYLSEIQVSTSYLAIPVNGGSASTTVTATGSWSIDGESLPSWLTASTLSGSAGESTLTFSADATLDGRTAELQIVCGDAVQNLNLIQGLSIVPQATCAEVIAGPESKTYLVTGICTKIANTNYGNWYLDDGTGEIYIYGTVNDQGSYAWSSFGIEVGDEVTVQGPKTIYNGTVELVDATFISVNKSLIKVESIDPEDATIPTEGGEVTITLQNKGNGLTFEVPEDAKGWLSISAISGNTVTLKATENIAGPRTTTLVFKTTDGKKDYSCETLLTQLGASGSEALPFTVEEAVAFMNAFGETTTSDFYVKGIVSKVVYTFSSGYGTGTFWISDDGVYDEEDSSHNFEAYSVYWLGNESWADGNSQIEVGAEVTLCGKLTLYKGIAETSSKNAYVYSINGVSSEENGVGTLGNPFNVAGAYAAATNGATGSNIHVKGVVSAVLYTFSASYGTGTFWISDDGTANGVSEDKKTTTEPTKDFEAYSVYWLGNQSWVDGNAQIAVGDEVILCGKITLYKGIAETSSKNAYVYSVNGVTE